MTLTRRRFLVRSAASGAALVVVRPGASALGASASPAQTTPPSPNPAEPHAYSGEATDIPKFAAPLLVPPVMPRAGVIVGEDGAEIDYYEVSVRQFEQQVLPEGLPATTVWGYGPVSAEDPSALLIHNAPSLTIEATVGRPVRVRWINELVDERGDYLEHLLPVDPTLHWANPAGGTPGRDSTPSFDTTPGPYSGPVPMVVHVHGAVGVGDESDGYPEAWYLPAARNIPPEYATEGTWYEFFRRKAAARFGVEWGPGFAVQHYPNAERAATNWYHDHTLGLTRLNVYAGPAGFYLVRGGPSDQVLDDRDGSPAVLPGPAPAFGDAFPPQQTYFEVPLAIQDRSFHPDGSLAYPLSREAFDGIVGPYLPKTTGDGHGGISPIWNPEFFGDTIIVNGATWPYLEVEQRRYRFRVLNGCQSRALILDFGGIPAVEVCQIGNEGGFLPRAVDLSANHLGRVPLGPAERADLVVDFARVPVGEHLLQNIGPDEPFGGGTAGEDFEPADPSTTGQILQFRVSPATAIDPTTPSRYLRLPAIEPLPDPTRTRGVALVEVMGKGRDAAGEEVEGPSEAELGTVVAGELRPLSWDHPVTEDPAVGDTEVWEIYNTTEDAHPIHIHEVKFEVLGREGIALPEGEDEEDGRHLAPDGRATGPEPWETGRKDTVLAYPGQITRVKATFTDAGRYVWHCHILEHEDNEMMRPYRIGPPQEGEPPGE
jgi:FtsP/CotA-like multicopper oxidase with cupredoxin domain